MSKIYRVAISSMLLIFITFVAASAENLPDTGQTRCYNYSGDEIACPQPGNSFYGQDATYTINPASYTRLKSDGSQWTDADPDWVMVKDNITGLIWEVKAIDESSNELSWQEALIFIQGLNENAFGGYTDWRLPTLKELISIVNQANYRPAINKDYFPNQIAKGFTTNVHLEP